MKIIMTMLVRNEADIIRANIEFHRSMGVDYFIIMDHGSEDETLDILTAYSNEGIATIYRQSDSGYYQSEWVTEMAREAFWIHKADWIINNDADEFWWPCHGNLKQSLSLTSPDVDGLFVKRYNFPPIKGMTSACFFNDMVYKDLRSVNSHGNPLPDKLCHRGCKDVTVSQGNHDARGSSIIAKSKSASIEIMHFPIRSLTQLTNKIRCGGKAYEDSPRLDKNIGSTWRNLYEVYMQTGLASYYNDQCLDKLQQMKYSAALSRWQRDDRLLRYLLDLNIDKLRLEIT
jgi:hypothetical protein